MSKVSLKIILIICALSFSLPVFAAPYKKFERNLKLGMTGEDIKTLQLFLSVDLNLNFEPAILGIFGPRTRRALRDFQGANGIDPTGILGPLTRSYLNNYIESSTSTLPFTKSDPQKISGLLAQAPDSTSIAVLIEFYTQPGEAEVSEVHFYDGIVKRVYHLVPVIAAQIPKDQIIALSKQQNIKTIELDKNAFKRLGTLTASSTINTPSSFAEKNLATTKSVSVAVVDSGIDYTHPDLAQYYAGGYNFINNTADAFDDNDHGTHVAGIILKTFKKFIGPQNTNPQLKLYSLKVLDAQGSGFFSNIIAALEWAVDNHINITNNSYGTTVDPGQIVLEAFNTADHLGLLSIAAGGNTGTCIGITDTVEYPARYPSVVAVAAIDDANSMRPCFSSTGSDIEIAAPGVSILSTKRGGGYIAYSGTSMSSPYVTGGAAVIFAKNNNKYKRVNDAVRNILDENSDDIGIAGRDPSFGFGIIDIPKALKFIKTPPAF
jgi:subtilisin family serine protease